MAEELQRTGRAGPGLFAERSEARSSQLGRGPS